MTWRKMWVGGAVRGGFMYCNRCKKSLCERTWWFYVWILKNTTIFSHECYIMAGHSNPNTLWDDPHNPKSSNIFVMKFIMFWASQTQPKDSSVLLMLGTLWHPLWSPLSLVTCVQGCVWHSRAQTSPGIISLNGEHHGQENTTREARQLQSTSREEG